MNNLEILLKEAFTNPDLRIEFYNALLNSEVYVPYESTDSKLENGILKKGEKITLTVLTKKDGNKIIPFFTSEEALKQVINSEIKCIKIRGKDFFEMIRGFEAVINPFLEIAKEFSVNEINFLMDNIEVKTLEENKDNYEEKDIIRQHDKKPEKLINSLKRYMVSDKKIKKSYIVLYDNPILNGKSQTLILVQCSDGFSEIKNNILNNFTDDNDSGYPLEIIQYKEGETICEIIENRYSPFYVKKLFGIF